MSKVGLLIRIEAKPEHVETIATLLRSAADLARIEEGTVTCFAFQDGPTTFGIFDTFDDEQGRNAQLDGRMAAALLDVAPIMLARDAEIQPVDILAATH